MTAGQGRARLRRRTPTVVWLVVLWTVLWGSWDATTLVAGTAAALGIVLAFPLPRMEEPFALRPAALLRLAAVVLGDVAGSALRVGWDAVRRGRRVRSAVIEIPMISTVDHVVALSANLITLSPGTVVVRIDVDRPAFFVYLLGYRSAEDAERARDLGIHVQRLVLHTFGPKEDD